MAIPTSRLGTIVDLVRGDAWDAKRLGDEVRARSALFAQRGVGRGSRVVVAHGGTPAFFADLLALWHVGACAACVNPGLVPTELINVCDFLDASAVLVDADFSGGTDLAQPVLCGAGAAASDAPLPGDSSLDDDALILFTSGTTGDPKGVVHTFRSLLARTALNRAHIGDETLARTLCVLPTHFGHGLIGNCLTPLLAGATLHLAGGMGLATAAGLGDLLTESSITLMSSVPSFWKLVLKVGRAPTAATLRQVGVGSAPLSADLWEQIIAWSGTRNVVNMYGITETANWIGGASAATHTPEDGLIGSPWGGAIAARAEDGRLLTDGDGELVVSTPSLMRGYYRRDDLTREVIENGWYRTGDVGRVDAEGVARLTGRIKHEINRAGMKIHPEDVDLLLERHPQVVEACAFGVPDAVSGEVVGVAVRATEDSGIDAATLRAWCSERVRGEAVPERWFLVPEIPKTDRGKLNRDTVRTFCIEGPR